jgi:hypothetical protein
VIEEDLNRIETLARDYVVDSSGDQFDRINSEKHEGYIVLIFYIIYYNMP